MVITKKECCENEAVEKIICNCCGEEIVKNAHGYFEDYIHIDKTWGYTSQKDGEKTNVDICEKCWTKIEKSFKIKSIN
jgi:hypothetical protein